MLIELLPPTTERVEQHTDPRINESIRQAIIEDTMDYMQKTEGEITIRIRQLDREWDIERVTEVLCGLFVCIGLAIGYFIATWGYVIAGIAGFFILQHSLQGWYGLLPLLRRMGVRTSNEIQEAKTAMRILRGDLDFVSKKLSRGPKSHQTSDNAKISLK